MTRDKYDELFEDGEDALDSIRSLMNSRDDLGLTGMQWADGGYIETRNVVATEPWRPSRVRLGERPRVELSTITRRCDHCHETYAARRQSSRYCGATCRQAAGRAAR
jgi:hypothetical protein